MSQEMSTMSLGPYFHFLVSPSSLWPSCPCFPFLHHPFSPCIPVPHSLIIPSPLTSLFPIPLSSLCPYFLVPCSLVIPLPLASLFPVPSSLAASTCDPPCKQWLTGLGAGAGLFLVVVSWLQSHPCCSSSHYPPYEQQLTAVAWVGAGVLSGCCLVIAELEPRKTKENINYLKKEKRTWEISYLGPKQHPLSFGPNVFVAICGVVWGGSEHGCGSGGGWQSREGGGSEVRWRVRWHCQTWLSLPLDNVECWCGMMLIFSIHHVMCWGWAGMTYDE